MAKQNSLVKLEGTIGDISFYKTKDGFMARAKGGISKKRYQNDPAFQRTRENGAEFGRAGAAGRTLRTAFRPLLQRNADSRITSRLTKEMLKVIKADATSVRGERNVMDGDLDILQGFEFNANVSLGSTIYAPFTVNIDRAAGTAQVTVPEFIPQEDVVAPQGSTHVKFITGGAEVDFENKTFKLATSESTEIEIGPQTEAALDLSNALTAGSTLPLFLVFGIEFYQEVNGLFYPMNNGTFNALTLVSVDKGA